MIGWNKRSHLQMAPGNTRLPPIYPPQPGHSLGAAWEQPENSLDLAWKQPRSSLEPAENQPGNRLEPAYNQAGTVIASTIITTLM